MSSSEVGKALSGGINGLAMSVDEKVLTWANNAGERIQRPADPISIYLWRQLRQAETALAAVNQQLADIISADRARVSDDLLGDLDRAKSRIADWKEGTLT